MPNRLKMSKIQSVLALHQQGWPYTRIADELDWPHEPPAIEMYVLVGFDGSIGEVDIRCSATDGDPMMEVFTAPNLQKCRCDLADLAVTLKEVWVARREVIGRVAAGEKPPIFDGKWNWTPGSHLLP